MEEWALFSDSTLKYLNKTSGGFSLLTNASTTAETLSGTSICPESMRIGMCGCLGLIAQLPVIEQALETASLMLGSDKSRGYCLEMICADFLAGAHADGGAPTVLLRSMLRLFQLAPPEQQQEFLAEIRAAA